MTCVELMEKLGTTRTMTDLPRAETAAMLKHAFSCADCMTAISKVALDILAERPELFAESQQRMEAYLDRCKRDPEFIDTLLEKPS